MAIKYLAGFALAALLLWWVFRGQDLAAVGAALREAALPGLALGLLLNLMQVVPRVWRWDVLLAPLGQRPHFRPMLSAVVIGYMLTWIVPGRLGEFVRPALLSAHEDLPLAPTMGTVLSDRLLDGVTIVGLFAVGVLWAEGPILGLEAGGGLRSGALGMLGVVSAFLVALTFLSIKRDPVERWVSRRSRPVRVFVRFWVGVSVGVEALRKPGPLFVVLAYSVAVWGLISLGTWIGVMACGVDLSLAEVFVLMPLLALGSAVPTPGNLGGYQAAMWFGLETWFGVDPAHAVSTGVLMHLSATVPLIVLGLVMLRLEGISWRKLMRMARKMKELGDERVGPVAEGTR